MILITSPFLQVMCLHPLCSQNMLRWTTGVEPTTQVNPLNANSQNDQTHSKTHSELFECV